MLETESILDLFFWALDYYFSDFVKTKTAMGISLGLLREDAEKPIKQYGSNVDELFEVLKAQTENSELPKVLRAQLIYSIEKEMCVSPADFFIRRTAMLYFEIDSLKKWKAELIDEMQRQMNWTEEVKEKCLKELNQILDETKKISE